MVKALAARALTTIVSAVMGILTARLILGSAGIEAFALYALITTLPSLMQFQDLGAGAALVNVIATSGDPNRGVETATTLTSVWRIMLIFAAAIMGVNGLLLITGGWSLLLGSTGHMTNASLAAFTCVAVWAINIPLGIWQRILLGLQKNHVTILIQGAMAPLNFGFAWLILQAGPSAYSFLALASYFAAFAIASFGMLVAFRHLPRAFAMAARRVWFPSRYQGVTVMDVGWPMLAQMLSAPLSITAQRYVLAQFAPPAAVGEYTAAAQVYLSLLGVISAAGVALWPHFARQRSVGTLVTGPFKLSVQFVAVCIATTALLYAVRGPLFAFTTNEKIEVQDATCIAFSLMLILQAALYPLGMFIMDKPGIRFQMVPTIIMAVGSLVMGILVTPTLGVIGPVLSNCLFVLFAQILPFLVYIHRNRDSLWGAVE